ncbi:MAG TPA: hypothetical protein VHN14_11930 [Kofleriaceae bacterium]|nr:hypothetical protein [Kofleriaceae bacterium]
MILYEDSRGSLQRFPLHDLVVKSAADLVRLEVHELSRWVVAVPKKGVHNVLKEVVHSDRFLGGGARLLVWVDNDDIRGALKLSPRCTREMVISTIQALTAFRDSWGVWRPWSRGRWLCSEIGARAGFRRNARLPVLMSGLPHRVDLAAGGAPIVVDVIAVVAVFVRIEPAIPAAARAFEVARRVAAIAIEQVAVVALFLAFLDAVAAHRGVLPPAMVVAAVVVGVIAVVALLAAIDRAVAADRLAVACRIAAIARRLVTVITGLAGLDYVVSADRSVRSRHGGREQHAGDQQLHARQIQQELYRRVGPASRARGRRQLATPYPPAPWQRACGGLLTGTSSWWQCARLTLGTRHQAPGSTSRSTLRRATMRSVEECRIDSVSRPGWSRTMAQMAWYERLVEHWQPSPGWRELFVAAIDQIARDPADIKPWCDVMMMFGDTHAPELALIVGLHAWTLGGDRSRLGSHLHLCLLDLGIASASRPVPLRDPASAMIVDDAALADWTAAHLAPFGGELARAVDFALTLARQKLG